MNKLSRLVQVDAANLKNIFQYINYAVSENSLVVRLLKNSSLVSNSVDFESNKLFTTESILSNQYVQYSGLTTKYNGKQVEVIAEAVFDYNKYPDEAKRPLGNFLIYLYNDRLVIDNYQLHTNTTHYRTNDYIKALDGIAFCLAQIYFVNPSDKVSNSSLSLVKFKDSIETISNIDFSKFLIEDSSVSADHSSPRSRFQPKLVLTPLASSVYEDQDVQIKVECILNNELCTDANFSIIIDAVDGYAAHKRVQLNNGEATFSVNALKLKAGSNLRVKVGLNHYSGLAECIIPVIANETQPEENVKTKEELLAELQASILSANQIKQDLKEYLSLDISNQVSALAKTFTSLQSSTAESVAKLTEKVDTAINDMNSSISNLVDQKVDEAISNQAALLSSIQQQLDEMSKVQEVLLELANKNA